MNPPRRSYMFAPPASIDLFIPTAWARHVKCDVPVAVDPYCEMVQKSTAKPLGAHFVFRDRLRVT